MHIYVTGLPLVAISRGDPRRAKGRSHTKGERPPIALRSLLRRSTFGLSTAAPYGLVVAAGPCKGGALGTRVIGAVASHHFLADFFSI